MQCVILAAGKGTRMRPLTEDKPKPMVSVDGQPLIEHVVSSLPEKINELVIVVGYKGEQIKDYCGDEFCGRPVRYVEQEDKRGTAHALFECKQHLNDRFLVLNADDLVGQAALEKALEHDICMLSYRHEHPERFGVIALDENGHVSDIVEKPDNPPSNRVSTGAIVLDSRVFEYELPLKRDDEHYLSDLMKNIIEDHDVTVVGDPHWHPVGYPEDIKKAEQFLAGLKAAAVK